MFERFTVQAREVVLRARQEATRLHHPYVGTEHMLVALLYEDSGIACTVLHDAGLDGGRVRADIQRLVGSPATILGEDDAAALQSIGIDLDAVLSRIEESFGPNALDPPAPEARRGLFGHKPVSKRAKKVLELSLREALRLKHKSIGTEHILLGLIREGDGLAAKIVTEAGVSLDDLRQRTIAALDKGA